MMCTYCRTGALMAMPRKAPHDTAAESSHGCCVTSVHRLAVPGADRQAVAAPRMGCMGPCILCLYDSTMCAGSSLPPTYAQQRLWDSVRASPPQCRSASLSCLLGLLWTCCAVACRGPCGCQDSRRPHVCAQLALWQAGQQLEGARLRQQQHAQLRQALLLRTHPGWALCLRGWVSDRLQLCVRLMFLA